MSTEPVYLDYAATTPVRPEVLEAMLPFFGPAFGNPSSSHRFGRTARAAVELAKRQVAEAVGAEPNQIIFTSGGTEADNLAVIGGALAGRDRGNPMIAAVSVIEHKAVLAAAHEVVHLGGEEILLPVTREGVVQMDALDEALARKPAVVSVMWVNNEIGVIQPIIQIADRCEAGGCFFHTDGVQAFGKIPVSLAKLCCTLFTLSGHKIGAPKGIGALIVRDRKAIEAIIHGGSQQYELRPGTENVAGIVALGRAAELAANEQAAEATRLQSLRERLVERIRGLVPDVVFVGESGPFAPHILNTMFPGVDGEALLMHLDLAGVACSSGSACSTGSVEPSHVLAAMGVPRELALGAVRFSFGHETTEADLERLCDVLPRCVEKVRKLAGVLGRV